MDSDKTLFKGISIAQSKCVIYGEHMTYPD